MTIENGSIFNTAGEKPSVDIFQGDVNVGRVVKDPGIRRIFLLGVLNHRVETWRKNGVDSKDIERQKEQFLGQIAKGMSQERAKTIIINHIALLNETKQIQGQNNKPGAK